MVKIEAVVHEFRVAEIKDALDLTDPDWVLVSESLTRGGCNRQETTYRGARYITEAPMVRLEMLVDSDRRDEVVDSLIRAGQGHGTPQNGVILITEIADAIQISAAGGTR